MVGACLFWAGVVNLDHRLDVSPSKLEFRNDGGPKQPALFFGALDQLVKLFVEFVGGVFCVFRTVISPFVFDHLTLAPGLISIVCSWS
jgi:hypothetical protein